MKENLLFELGCEELPPKALRKLAQALADSLQAYLIEHQFITKENKLDIFATPRRLAVKIHDVLAMQPTQQVERKGPSVKAAYDNDGNLTKAAQGFLRSLGLQDASSLETLKTEQGEWLYYKADKEGQSLQALIEEGINTAIKKLPIPKRMRWGTLSTEFVRPVHWVVLMYGADVLECSVLGIQSGNKTQGHRFHANKALALAHANDYETVLEEQGSVIVDYERRLQIIDKGVRELAQKQGVQLVENNSLLNEVTALVEWPEPLMGEFSTSFLELPKEVLISSMQDHQKYFSFVDNDNQLAPYFVTISNIKSKNPAQVQHGNERVLRARLQDAEFFWQQDQKTPLEANIDKLSSILFHHKLGSVDAKVKRIAFLAKNIAHEMGNMEQNNSTSTENIEEKAELAASLIKADLVSGMVGEFPELQGIMGRYYAQQQGIDEQVCEAIEQHYFPKQAGGELPNGDVATALALADKLDTIVGIFLADEIPTGDKDPYALRRQSLGILRILVEKEYDFSIDELVANSVSAYQGNSVASNVAGDDKKAQQISQFIKERLKNYYQAQGIDTNVYLSVAAVNPAKPLDFEKRIRAVDSFRALEAAQSLAASNKRINNILEKNGRNSAAINADLLDKDEEKTLVASIEKVSPNVQKAMDDNNYLDVLNTLAELKEPIDNFFEHVKVIDDNDAVKQNRLAILTNLQNKFVAIADIALLSQAK